MEKILLIIDAKNFKPEMLDFVAGVTIPGESKVTGIFLYNEIRKETPQLRSMGGQIFVDEITLTEEEIKQKEKSIDQCSLVFKEECARRNINAAIHSCTGDSFKQILKESRYTDLIIIDPRVSLSTEKTVPTTFIKELLVDVECPVLIAPENFHEIDEIVFAYDGSKSSAFAIKQFCYQMPKFADRKVVVLHITEPDKAHKEDLIGISLFEEWLKMRFPRYSFVTVPGDPRGGLLTYFMDYRTGQHSLLVIGAFGRNQISTFFKPSASELVLKAIDIPVFISHY